MKFPSPGFCCYPNKFRSLLPLQILNVFMGLYFKYQNLSLNSVFFQNLGFHDCVSGCDGCINLDNAANNGLSPAIDAMEEILTEITGAGISVSRADLWAIGGRAAAEFGMENMPGNSGWVKGVNRQVLLVR